MRAKLNCVDKSYKYLIKNTAVYLILLYRNLIQAMKSSMHLLISKDIEYLVTLIHFPTVLFCFKQISIKHRVWAADQMISNETIMR